MTFGQLGQAWCQCQPGTPEHTEASLIAIYFTTACVIVYGVLLGKIVDFVWDWPGKVVTFVRWMWRQA